jgi:hypothetical protein
MASTEPRDDEQVGSVAATIPNAAGDFLSWAEYANAPIFTWLTNINSFSVSADIPPVFEINDRAFLARLGADVYQHMQDLVEAAKFFEPDQIHVREASNQLFIVYEDDRFDFALEILEDRIRIRRSGSSFDDFHQWFSAFNRGLPDFINKILETLKNLTSRKYTVQRASFSFGFILHSVKTIGSNPQLVRNTEIMKRLVRGLPDDDGTLSDSEDTLATAGRIDCNFSRWRRVRDQWRLERYNVEGPANKEGKSVWTTFQYGGETYADPRTQQRVAFQPTGFFSEGDVAYAEFLRERAIRTFLTSLLAGHSFESTAGVLP